MDHTIRLAREIIKSLPNQRERIAAQVMAGLAAFPGDDLDAEDAAICAVTWADALIEELEKEEE